jgi:hypothetical protein
VDLLADGWVSICEGLQERVNDVAVWKSIRNAFAAQVELTTHCHVRRAAQVDSFWCLSQTMFFTLHCYRIRSALDTMERVQLHARACHVFNGFAFGIKSLQDCCVVYSFHYSVEHREPNGA